MTSLAQDPHPSALLQATLDTLVSGQRCAIATLVASTGSSPRPLGAQMLIREDGSSAGLISSACIEQAIIGQALEAIAEGCARKLRYGKDSPWFDLQLPSGSGIDIHVAVQPDASLIEHSLAQLQLRKRVRWQLDEAGQWQLAQRPQRDAITQLYEPRWQLHAIGRGAALASLAAIATPCDIDVHIYSPDTADMLAAEPFAATVQQIPQANDFSCPKLDRYCAAVTLFHDHDWEPPILQALLNSNAGYIAALGSPRSHATRLMQLSKKGVSAKQAARIKGPAGLDINAATSAEIALAIVAEIVQKMRG